MCLLNSKWRRLPWLVCLFAGVGVEICAAKMPPPLSPLLKQACFECHDASNPQGGLDLTSLRFNPEDPVLRERWIRIHDRIEKEEMPPRAESLPPARRTELVHLLGSTLRSADHRDILRQGRGPLRRLNREEYEQNLRDALRLPGLDIRDVLPEDRESHRFNKTTETLDLSRVQLAAYLEAAETALRQALASGLQPPTPIRYHALATRMFQEAETFGGREAMFYAKNSKGLAIDASQLQALRRSGQHDPSVELALFRSAHWPYYGYPEGFVAPATGDYKVRFSARSVLQIPGYELRPGTQPRPLTFRARKPSGPDVSGDVRATGGILDIQPESQFYETTVQLRAKETIEYSLLGLPVPLARNVNNGPPTYRYPPFPEGGQPGVAFQSIEIEGPLTPALWPPPSHRVLFEDLPLRAPAQPDRLPVEVIASQPRIDGPRLLRQFIQRVARQPVPETAVHAFEQLILQRLDQNVPFAEAVLTGYQAFLCSPHFLYLTEPSAAEDHHAIASRLSHFLTNTRPDDQLAALAHQRKLRHAPTLRAETKRLIASPGFDRFVKNFTDYWLNLRHVRRQDPDVRLYPEYRFNDYLVESMARETRAFVTALFRDNLPVETLVRADFVYANDCLADHYGLPPLSGSALRRVPLPPSSPYGGLLTQAAILKVTANGTTTSPVLRGAWVMERLLGSPPPPPPPNVPAVEPDIRGAQSIRELLALHTRSKSCAACHAKFDPVGLALENFDILGRWRTRYRGLELGERISGIDRAGHDFAYTLNGAVSSQGQLVDGRRFADIHELKALLAAQPRQLARNLLHQFTVYATGTPVRFSDRPEIEALLDTHAAAGYRVQDLLLGLVQSKIFLGPHGCR